MLRAQDPGCVLCAHILLPPSPFENPGSVPAIEESRDYSSVYIYMYYNLQSFYNCELFIILKHFDTFINNTLYRVVQKERNACDL